MVSKRVNYAWLDEQVSLMEFVSETLKRMIMKSLFLLNWTAARSQQVQLIISWNNNILGAYYIFE